MRRGEGVRTVKKLLLLALDLWTEATTSDE
jgi:hypothetical protein